MKINTLGYTLTLNKTLPSPEQVEATQMEEGERDAYININAQLNQIAFLENMYEAYEEAELTDKMTQTETSLDAARNTLLQWETKLYTINEWFFEQE
jgi:hypothetical protein